MLLIVVTAGWRFLAAEVKYMSLKSWALTLSLALFFSEGVVWARTADMKMPCVNCHTMHNSQGGNVVPGNAETQGALLNNSCYGCHTGLNAGDDTAPRLPMVLHTSVGGPHSLPYLDTGTEDSISTGRNTLAGGDFGWVAIPGNDLKGHNVMGISLSGTLTCAGTTGCHGNLSSVGDSVAMSQTHHAVESAQPMDGSSLIKSYRWLDGVAGFEDPDYELSVDSLKHNQYKGVARPGDTDEALTISHFCAKCHGNFHWGAGDVGVSAGAGVLGADPWIRHPTDYAMPLTGEYAGYGDPSGAPVGNYNYVTPVGSVDVSTIKTTVTGSALERIVTCVSCHRAHGSPYDYSLRWDYKNWPGGANSHNGCGDCHTAKN